jgi:DNA-binding NtrC family response regulator
LLPDFLPAAIRGSANSAAPAFDFGDLTVFIQDRLKSGVTSLYADYQAITDRHLLNEVLHVTAGNLSQAARYLGITRATLRTKLNALGIPVERHSASESKTPPA